ncbi:MAG TPA: ferredoxin [Gaiellaceae bacterium]|jgi:ferredoxin
MFRVEIDSDLCSGFASCVDDAPGIFKLDDSGKATVLVPETDDERALKAAKDCPMAAIAVFDVESGGRVV